MQEQILHFFRDYPHLAIATSLCISILIAIAGIIPSVFITGANILFFGFWQGTALSFAGEAIGAPIAFWLYRKGFKKTAENRFDRYPKAKQLLEAEGTTAFTLILSLRLLPFIPSGLVTFAAAIGKVSILIFVLASSLGKIPALLIEAYAVYQVTQFGWQGKVLLLIIGCALIYYVLKKLNLKAK